MTPEQFCYWLQGFVEMNNGIPPSDQQWQVVCDHLKTVFVKVTPSYPKTDYPIPMQPQIIC